MTAVEVLKDYFGYDAFRPVQEQVVNTILSGRDTVAIMPTGAGKSICFQVPALLMPHGTVIISPLISLMKDQVEGLVSQGIPASFVNSTISHDESIARLRDLYRGTLKLLYMAPEKLEPSYFVDCLRQVPLSMIVIDEAHCVSQWGHDFRPSYCRIRDFISSLPQKPVVSAFTATATPVVEADMRENLDLAEAECFRTSLDRPNLSFRVFRNVKKNEFLLRYVEAHKSESGIIYCATRKTVDEVYQKMRARGICCGRYHAGMSDGERKKAQEDFSYDRISVIAATNAFGMGIDKSNVRYVLHYQMPKSLESYYQEAGRAGRDGAPAECILLYSGQDAVIQKFLIEQGNLSDNQIHLEYDRMNKMIDYCQTSVCLRNYILTYFGEKPQTVCGHCGSCETSGGRVCITDAAMLMFRTILAAGERFGASVIADILKGSRSQRLKDWHLTDLPTYGKLNHEKTGDIKSALNECTADGYLMRDGGAYPILKLTDKAREVLNGKEEVFGFAFGASEVIADTAVKKQYHVSDTDTALFEALRRLRRSMASEEKVPPFVIFSDATLEEMASVKPKTKEELSGIKGVGMFKLQKYGARFLATIRAGTVASEAQKKPAEEPAPTVRKWTPADALEEKTVFEYLRRARKTAAEKAGKAPFQIMPDSALHEMAKRIPKNRQEMLQIRGIGETRWESCGKLFLEALRKGMEAAEKGFPPEIVFRKRKMAAKENTDGISAGEDRNEQSR